MGPACDAKDNSHEFEHIMIAGMKNARVECFLQWRKLQKHSKQHYPSRKYVCRYLVKGKPCGRCFSQQSGLSDHLNVSGTLLLCAARQHQVIKVACAIIKSCLTLHDYLRQDDVVVCPSATQKRGEYHQYYFNVFNFVDSLPEMIVASK